MTGTSVYTENFKMFVDRLRREISPYAGSPEYGYIRFRTDVWESGGVQITNIALVYDRPGGSTDQINVSFDYGTGFFALIDEEERLTADVEQVIAWILPRVKAIAAVPLLA